MLPVSAQVTVGGGDAQYASILVNTRGNKPENETLHFQNSGIFGHVARCTAIGVERCQSASCIGLLALRCQAM
jgi:hypothetical protein